VLRAQCWGHWVGKSTNQWDQELTGFLTKSEERGGDGRQPEHDAPGVGRQHHIDHQRPQDADADGQLVQAAQHAPHLRRRDLQQLNAGQSVQISI
jgi:hypothetical protein